MLKKRRWQMVLLLFIAGIINYLDRSALSVAAPLVSSELGLSPADLGLIFSSFFLGYALFNFIGGWAADRIGGRAGLRRRNGGLVRFLWPYRRGRRLHLIVHHPGDLRHRRRAAVGHDQQMSTTGFRTRGGECGRVRQLRHPARWCDRRAGGRLDGRRPGLAGLVCGHRRPRFHLALFWLARASETPRQHPTSQPRSCARSRSDHAWSERPASPRIRSAFICVSRWYWLPASPSSATTISCSSS